MTLIVPNSNDRNGRDTRNARQGKSERANNTDNLAHDEGEGFQCAAHLNSWLDRTAAALAEDFIMNRRRLLPDFVLANGDGSDHPFHEFLTDLNIVMLTHVPEASHGPASELLRSLVAQVGCLGHVRIRGFDIRSFDGDCSTCTRPHVVYAGQVVTTICDSGETIRRLLGVCETDRFFVVGAGRRIMHTCSIDHVLQLSRRLNSVAETAATSTARAPPRLRHTG